MSVQSLDERSDQFESALAEFLGPAWFASFPTDPRYRASVAAARLSAEHGRGVRILLLQSIAPQSGTALLRLQFEALLRSAWLLFCATDAHVEKLTSELSLDSEQAAKNLPGSSEMLASVARSAPVGLSDPLAQFHRSSWRALNSYVHAGIHPLERATRGFPVELADGLVRLSNGLTHVAYRLQASLLGQETLDQITKTWVGFRDVLPPITLGHDAPSA